MESCKEAFSPASPSARTPAQEVEDVVGQERHEVFRQAAGQLQWQVCLRPDIAFMARQVARPLTVPTEGDFKVATHLFRHAKGTLYYKMAFRPSTILPVGFGQETDRRVYVDANFVGCPSH